MERMKEAYGMLYDIETSLRQYIEDEMISRYGPKWKKPDQVRTLQRASFYELENYLRIYNFKLPRGFILNLKGLYPIRNKIAHCHELTNEEFLTLEASHEVIMNVIFHDSMADS